MSDTQSLSERLRDLADHLWDVEYRIQVDEDAKTILEAADALDQRDAEIALLKEGRKLHDELADHKDAEIEKWQRVAGQGVSIEHELRKDLLLHNALLAQAAAALEHFAWDTTGVVLLKEGPVEYSRKAREALAAIRATLVEKVDD